MRIFPVYRVALLCFYVSLVFAATFCYAADDKTVEVVGIGECADCAESNIKTVHAFSGLKVSVDCKPEKGEFKTKGVGELDEGGRFKVSLPKDFLKDGKLKEECYAQLHSASAAPCPAHNGLESSKIILQSKTDEKHTFGLAGKLKFSSATCASAFLWPHPKLPKHPPLPKSKLPPLKSFHHPYLFPPKVYTPHPPKVFPPKPFHPPVPVYKPPKVLPPPVPIYKPKPKPPVFKPSPVLFYKPKPKPPVYKPHPVPIYKPIPKPPIYKPLPPPVPIYKPLPPPVPIYKPLPPIPKIPPFYKKPCPPKLPPYPKIPPKYFHHPKFGKWPPLPPHSPIH